MLFSDIGRRNFYSSTQTSRWFAREPGFIWVVFCIFLSLFRRRSVGIFISIELTLKLIDSLKNYKNWNQNSSLTLFLIFLSESISLSVSSMLMKIPTLLLLNRERKIQNTTQINPGSRANHREV